MICFGVKLTCAKTHLSTEITVNNFGKIYHNHRLAIGLGKGFKFQKDDVLDFVVSRVGKGAVYVGKNFSDAGCNLGTSRYLPISHGKRLFISAIAYIFVPDKFPSKHRVECYCETTVRRKIK